MRNYEKEKQIMERLKRATEKPKRGRPKKALTNPLNIFQNRQDL